MPLSHVVGLITGGASGLGAATASTLIRAGARVVVADLPHQYERYLQLAEAVCRTTTESYPSMRHDQVISFVETDVTSEEQVMKALDAIEAQYGEPVNAAINCAGIGIAKKTLSKNRETGQLIPHVLDDFRKSLTINTVGSFNVARLAAERMASRQADQDGLRGCIINTASIAAMDGQRGQVAYAASKAALVGMTLPMARDLSSFGIRVMTIAPGLFETPLLEDLPENVKQELGNTVPLPSRLGRPDEFGSLVSTILQNSMLNGEVIRLDGALRMPP